MLTKLCCGREILSFSCTVQAAAVLSHTPQPSVGSQVEERLRRTSQTGRIRFSEFFKDFDPLKSGVITSMC